MNEYIAKIKVTIEENQLISQGDDLVVGLSGGVDSVALLGLLIEIKESYKLNIHPMYVHHNLREDAKDDVLFCKSLCEKLGLECEVTYVDVPKVVKDTKKSEEEVARNLRYEALKNYKNQIGANAIAVAHHKEDLGKTIIHRFL